jgi:predicted signal transduction protein with EAL and GGDEF domain
LTRLANRRVLVIDDTASIREDFRRILCSPAAAPELEAAEEALFGHVSAPAARFELDFAAQGREGCEKVQASLATDTPYALAFIDMRMPPGWDGVETIQQIWKVDPRLQVVICTAHSDYSWDQVLGALGVEDRLLILKKPFDTVEVAQLASALTTKWDMTRRAELKVALLEMAVQERTDALSLANLELEAMVREVTEQATHDTLTGLPNRLLFAERAVLALAAARRSGAVPVVMMLDLDGFKEVNDTLGHHHGDLLLNQVAQRLSEVLRESDIVARFGSDQPGRQEADTVARFGGDEFELLLTDGGAAAGTRVAARIAKALEDPFQLGDFTVGVEASIGIADTSSAAADGPSLEELLRQADIAMYKAKTDRSGFAHYGSCHDDGTRDRLTLIGELRQALDRQELALFYQPKVAVGTGELLGVEALVRWQHPSRGLLLPAEFIGLAESSSLIHRLTATVVDQALHFCRSWLDQGVRLPVAINISARSLFSPDFPVVIQNQLGRAGVPADLLTIELTEGSVMSHPDAAHRIFRQLRDMKVRLSVDDYGTGYSSLSYLKNLPVDEIKIDQSFIAAMTDDPKDAIIVQSTLDLGHDLGLSIVAEGVGNATTLAVLRGLGVDIVQGFHIGDPMPESILRGWIAHRTSNPTLPRAMVAGPAPEHVSRY